MVSEYRGIVSGRRRILDLPAIMADSVVLVNDSTACWRARQVYVKDVGSDTLHSPTVYLLKVGSSRYVVTDRRVYGGHSWDLVTDTSFAVIVFAMD
jgi:hypothetical protein